MNQILMSKNILFQKKNRSKFKVTNFKNKLKSIRMNFKKFKKKLIKIFVSFLFICSFTVNSAQGTPLPGAEAFPVTYICRKRETYSRQATGLRTDLKKTPNHENIPRENKARHDRHFAEFNHTLEDSQIQAKFKHAKDFGVRGNGNRENYELWKDGLIEHMKKDTVKRIEGKFRKNIDVIHYFEEGTGLNVMINATNNKFISGWKLGKEQLEKFKNEGDFF
jgi:hypothetical protein